MPRLRLVLAVTGLILIATSATALLWPVLSGSGAASRTAAIKRLPDPQQIISPAAFPSPLPVGNQQIPRLAPVSLDGWRIRLPSLKIDLPLVQGYGSNVPYYMVAHYPTMPWPGQGQRSFVYAHAQYGPPIMFGPLLNHDVTGVDVYVTRPGRPELHYVIRQYYPAWPISDTKWLQPADHEELILMTCTSWNAWDPRVIAVAEPA